MNRILRLNLVGIVVFLLAACATTPKAPEKPEWIDEPGMGAVGFSGPHVRGRHYQEDLAIGRARERLAARYGVEVSSVQTIRERVVNDRAFVSSEKEINQRINKATVKARVRETWRNTTSGEVWVWVYPINE